VYFLTPAAAAPLIEEQHHRKKKGKMARPTTAAPTGGGPFPLPDLTVLNDFYNQNGGAAHGQICGQSLMTKLLRNKKSFGTRNAGTSSSNSNNSDAAPLSQNVNLIQKDARLCMSPILSGTGVMFGTGTNDISNHDSQDNNNKQKFQSRRVSTKYHNSNTYENMNHSSIDTESCSSDGIFSETSTSNASSSFIATIDDIQAPVFVAQFDPMHLGQSNGDTNAALGTSIFINNVPLNRKSAVSWSSSLPAVVEEDSQSEQGSQQNHHQEQEIWQNTQGMLGQSSQDDQDFMLGTHDENLPDQQQKQHQPVTLHRLVGKTPVFGPNGEHPPKAQPNSSPSGKKSKQKQEKFRKATERRIQQALDEKDEQHNLRLDNLGNPEQHVRYHANDNPKRLEIFDGAFAGAGEPRQNAKENLSIRNIENESDSFFRAFEPTAKSCPVQRPVQSSRLDDNRSSPHDKSTSLQDLLLQQETTLNEMSLQSYQYRREIGKYQEIFGRWKIERENQQNVIHNLVKEKDAYAAEAKFLRNEMSAIRTELEALKIETHLHNESQSTQHQQQCIKSPHGAERSRKAVLSTPIVDTTPSPPPPQPKNCSNGKRDAEENRISIMYGSGRKPSSMTKTAGSCTLKRSVKFHDPPKNKEWTLFPSHRHDNRTSTEFESPFSCKTNEKNKRFPDASIFRVETRQQEACEGEGTRSKEVRAIPDEKQVSEQQQDLHSRRSSHVRLRSTPTTSPSLHQQKPSLAAQPNSPTISTCTSTSKPAPQSFAKLLQRQQQIESNNELASAYRYRLENIQRHRQERATKKGRSANATAKVESSAITNSSNRIGRDRTPERRHGRGCQAAEF